LSDAASYDDALRCFEESVERARRCDSRRQVAWSLALMGRTHALLGRHAEARGVLEQSLALIADEKWIAVAPLPEVMLAHVDLREGRVDAAAEGLEHAFTIACQLADPCWEAIACRGIGLVEAARGRGEQALAWLTDGRSRCTRVAHPYQWIHAWVLDGMCAGAQRYEDERVVDWADDLRSLASRTGMRELLLRAYLYRARDGDVQARDAARLLGAEIDNPHVWDDFSV
jgi:tetratricopeptide (TPR) repeat protein